MIKILVGICMVLVLVCTTEAIIIKYKIREISNLKLKNSEIEMKLDFVGRTAETLNQRRLFEDSLLRKNSKKHEEQITAIRGANIGDLRRIILVSLADTSRHDLLYP